MKDFLRYSKNRFLYSFFKLLILIAIGFLIGSFKVKAATYEYQIFGGVNDSEFGIEANGSKISTGDKFIFYNNTMNNYMYVDICTTGNAPSTWVYDVRDGSVSISTQVLKVNKRCVVSGYEADVYRFTFFVATASDIGQDRLGLNFTTRLFNNTSYYTFMRILSVFGSDTLSYADIEAGQNDAIQSQQKEAIEATKKVQEEQKKTNEKLDEAENTRKGIWETIKSIPGTIGTFFDNLGTKIGNFFKDLLDGILEGLKKLFIPEDDYFKNWFDDFKTYFEEKLGFIATPFTIIIDFVNSYLNLSSSNDIIIDVPDITVPNFEENKIISATTFNWSQTLRSKQALNTLWQLYLSFIDVYLILNFINLCESKYNRIFGGDTTNYEYYTVEDSYTFDNDTGEVLSARRNERTTTRKKVE